MFLKQVEVGLMQNFNYLIGCPVTKECAIVDPAWEPDRMLKLAEEEGYRVTKILLTHNHFDHIEGVPFVREKTDAIVYVHGLDEAPLLKQKKVPREKIVNVVEGSTFSIGQLAVQCLHTPGHTPGCTCYLIQDQHLFTGDTLFQGTCGRCDLPGSSPKDLYNSLQRLASLDPSIKVYPGHDYGTRAVTSIGYEQEHNPALKGEIGQ